MNTIESNSLMVDYELENEGVIGFLGGLFGGGDQNVTLLTLT